MHYRLVIRSLPLQVHQGAQYERWRTGDIPFSSVTVANPEVSDVLSEIEKKPAIIFDDILLPSHIAGIYSRIGTVEETGLNYPPVVICASCVGLTWVRSQHRPLKTSKSVEKRHNMRALIIHRPLKFELQQERGRTFPVGYMTNTETSFLPLKPYMAALPVSPLVAQRTVKCSRSLPDFPSFLLTRKNSNRFLLKDFGVSKIQDSAYHTEGGQ